MTDFIRLICFGVAAVLLPMAQAAAEDGLGPIGAGARTLEQSTPTFVLAVVCIAFAVAIVRLNQRNEKITERLMEALENNTEAFTALKTIVDEYHRKGDR